MPTSQSETAIASCSFCGKLNTEVHKLVAGPGVFICDGCVAAASQIISGKEPPVQTPGVLPWERESTLGEVLDHLAPVAAAGEQIERNLGTWVAKARALGATWSQIGRALGTTRQSAWERFSHEE